MSRRPRMARICTTEQSCQNQREASQTVNSGHPETPGDPAGQQGADATQDQPVEENQGDDELVPLELG